MWDRQHITKNLFFADIPQTGLNGYNSSVIINSINDWKWDWIKTMKKQAEILTVTNLCVFILEHTNNKTTQNKYMKYGHWIHIYRI